MALFKPSHLPLGRKRNTKHDSEQVVLQTYAAREDLRETPLESPSLTLFMNGSSFVEHGARKAGYAVVTLITTPESTPFSRH